VEFNKGKGKRLTCLRLVADIEVNYMDDVGQTLLNWASAFGTQEMVEFLCERGADVNRGLRSSSLHYAACFGRPNIVKVTLLLH
jgi:E3 ubiquitin-protein ligase HECTD1